MRYYYYYYYYTSYFTHPQKENMRYYYYYYYYYYYTSYFTHPTDGKHAECDHVKKGREPKMLAKQNPLNI
jgi:hypothetical protein